MKLYFKYLKVQFKTNITYRGSSLMLIFGQLLTIIATLIGIYCLFGRFETLGEYTFNDILITYSIIIFVFSFDEMFFRGFDEFDNLIRTGEMDRLLLRPRNLVLQICGHKVEIAKMGRAIIGIILIILACIFSSVKWNFWNVLIVIEMILSGIITFFGVYLFTSCITIFTIQKAEFINIFTDGGRELCYYPLDIFKKIVTKFFTFIIPYASFNYLPLRYLLGFADANVWYVIFPFASIIFCILGYITFNFCMKFYKSAG